MGNRSPQGVRPDGVWTQYTGGGGGGRGQTGGWRIEDRGWKGRNSVIEREKFLQAAVAVGCPEDQTRNFVAAKVLLQERQLVASAAARLCDQPNGPTAI